LLALRAGKNNSQLT